MHLFKQTGEFLKWLGAVLEVFLRTHPVLTPVLIISQAAASITRMLAFFIPLKVILLVATPGVPRYFEFLMDPELGDEWAIALTIAAVGAYMVTLLLDKLCDYWSELGSRNLLQQSSQMSVIANQRKVAKQYYASFSDIAAALLLVTSLFAVGGFLYPTFFGFFAALIAAEWLFSWMVLRFVDPIEPRGLGGYIVRETGSYLGYLEAITFLGIFLFLITDFLLFEGVNILVAILSFIMSRRMLSAVSGFVQDATSAVRQRHRIDPLIFLDEKITRRQTGRQQKLGHYYQVGDREQRLKQILGLSGIKGIKTVSSSWIDPGAPGMYLFEVRALDDAGNRCFSGLEQVVSQSRQQPLENEAIIVDELGRGALHAPRIVHQCDIGEFVSRLLDLECARSISPQEWNRHYQEYVLHALWQIRPTSELKRIYELSKPYLHERLSSDILGQMEVAVDTRAKEVTFVSLQDNIDDIRGELAELPVFPFNRALSPRNVYVDERNRFIISDWGRWDLEPIGVGLESKRITDRSLKKAEEKLRVESPVHARYMSSQLRLAAHASDFEHLLVRSRFNGALVVGRKMLNEWDYIKKDRSTSNSKNNKRASNA